MGFKLNGSEFFFLSGISSVLPLDVIFWKFNVSLWSHNLDAENDKQKSNKRNNPGPAWHLMKAPGVSSPWHRISSSFPDAGDSLQLLETKMMPFRDPRSSCLLGGRGPCCGEAAHHKPLIPFWLNSCKFGLHALMCGQWETTGRASSEYLGLGFDF